MPDDERKFFDRANTEKLLQQIEESLTHSREIIDQIDIIRQLRKAGSSLMTANTVR